ncbi:MAG: hypothetical protein JOZ68_03055 [Acidimicrobiia bacterium]|nr:hypothetical protein [Acidimicrobiia bacterium]
MRRLVGFLSLFALFAGGLTVGTAVTASATTTCNGFIQNQTIVGNLYVPGTYCELQNVTIKGSVTAQPGSALILDAPVHITGNLTAYNMNFSNCSTSSRGIVQIDGSIIVNGGAFQICDNWKVLGSVNISSLFSGPFVSSECDGECGLDPDGVQIGGSFTLQNNSDKTGQMLGWTVGGSGFINNNGGGNLDISNSTFGSYLTCSGNTTGFTGTGDNSHSQAGPNKNGFVGQCAGLGGGGSPG